MTVILFIAVLAVLVFVHELGHFAVAKKLKVLVHEFAIGFPPRLFSRTYGETKYSINIVPFGGYVKIEGEDAPSSDGKPHDETRSLFFRPAWQKIAVLCAGVFSNIVLAWIFISISLSSGMTSSISEKNQAYAENPRVMITGVKEGSPANVSKLTSGESVVAVSTAKSEKILISSPEQLRDVILKSNGSPIVFHTIEVGKPSTEEKNTIVTPKQGIVGSEYGIGISMDFVGELNLPLWRAFVEGAKTTGFMLYDIAKGLGGLVFGAFTGSADLSQVSGPVGIANLVGEARELGVAYFLSFVAFISLNLAVLNLIPFPALDGGRILFVLIEKIKGSPIKPTVANTVNAVGFGILMIFMVFITVRDVLKLF